LKIDLVMHAVCHWLHQAVGIDDTQECAKRRGLEMDSIHVLYH
jgi:hypothetical protein